MATVRNLYNISPNSNVAIIDTAVVLDEWPEGDPRWDVEPGGPAVAWWVLNGWSPGPNYWYKDFRNGTRLTRQFMRASEAYESQDVTPPPPAPDE